MKLDDLTANSSGGKPASQAYWNALRKLREAWDEVFDEKLPAEGQYAMESFESALENMKQRLDVGSAPGKRFYSLLDVQAGEDIGEVLLGWADLDDLPPNTIKNAIEDELIALGSGRHQLRKVLRAIMDEVFEHEPIRRPRIGANRHWPRLLQYLRELEEATDWSPVGRGVRLANSSQRGRVASEPNDPLKLDVLVDVDFLR